MIPLGITLRIVKRPLKDNSIFGIAGNISDAIHPFDSFLWKCVKRPQNWNCFYVKQMSYSRIVRSYSRATIFNSILGNLILFLKNKVQMSDLGLYENFLEHARVAESLLYRRRSATLRNMELAFEMPDSEFIGLYRLSKSVCLELIGEVEPYLPSRRGGISVTAKVSKESLLPLVI